MERKSLSVKKRELTGKRTRFMREKGIIPAVVYGKGMEAVSLEVNAKDFNVLMHAGRNVIIDLKIDQKDVLPVLTHEIQTNPVTDQILNIDFMQIRMDEEITAMVKVLLVGTSVGVKEDGGILVNPLSELEISCLPDKIPEKIEIEISALKINDAIHVSDLPKIPGVEFLTPGQDIVVTIAPPAKEEVAAPAAEAVPAEGAAAPVEGAPAAEGEKGAPAPAAGAKPETKKAEKETKK